MRLGQLNIKVGILPSHRARETGSTIVRCWLEQTENFSGSLEFSQAGTLGGPGVILGMQP